MTNKFFIDLVMAVTIATWFGATVYWVLVDWADLLLTGGR